MESELHVAIHKGQFHDIRLLISAGVDVNVRNQEGITPLITCSFLSQEDWAAGIARMILQNGGLVGIKDKSGRNGLIYAAIFRRIELVKMFLQAVDYDLNETDRFGNSALFYAASTGDAIVTHDIVQRLKHFKLSMNISNKWGMTPLMEACRLGHKECSSVLRNVGFADENFCDKILGWNAVSWTAERERELEARQRKRSLYKKPWRENAKGKYSSLTEDALSRSLSNEGSWPSSRSVSELSFPTSSVLTTKPAKEGKLPMLKCRRKLKIEKIKRNWIAEVVNKNVIEVKYQPSPIGYAASTANRVPSGTPSRKLCTKTNQSSTLYNSEPWLNNFKQIFRQYELQVTDSYRSAAVAPIKVPEFSSPSVPTKRGAKEQNEDKKGSDHRNHHASTRVLNMESKPLSNWPSLSSIASGKKSRTADEIVEIFLGSAKGKREPSLAQWGEANRHGGGKDAGSSHRKKHNGCNQTKKKGTTTT